MKFAYFVLFFSSFLYSGTIDAISVILNKEPITLYEVYNYSDKYNISKQQALELLIKEKLQLAEIKKRNIFVDKFEIDAAMEKIALKQNMSLYEFSNFLRAKGINENKYKKDLKKRLEIEKLYASIIQNQDNVSDAKITSYYNLHKDEFQNAKNFNVIEYTSSNKFALYQLSKNPILQNKNISTEHKNINISQTSLEISSILNASKTNTFTKPIRVGSKYVMFFIKNKNITSTKSLEQVKDQISQKLSSQNKEEIINDFFQKQRLNADIQIIRPPR